MQLEKAGGESAFDYHKRLVYGKLVDKTLADIDYSELAELVYGQQYSSDVARRMMYGSRKTIEVIESERLGGITDKEILSDVDNKIIELRKERQKFFDQRNAFSKVVRERSRQEELNEILVSAVRDGNLPSLNYIPNDVSESDNDLLISLTDIHYGIDINNVWNVYNPDRCREMMCEYLDKIILIRERHNSENCIVFANGDLISGAIHKTVQIANKENVINQVKGVSELIAEFLVELSKHFRYVKFISVAGNHSRLWSKDDSPIDERVDDLIEWYLGARLQNLENVMIGCQDKVDSTMYLIDIRGKTYCGTHGDYEDSVSKISSLQAMARKPVYAILCGHKHYNMVTEVNGTKVVMAGSFLGMDDYYVKKRIYGKPEQMVCVCNDDGILCHYDIEL